MIASDPMRTLFARQMSCVILVSALAAGTAVAQEVGEALPLFNDHSVIDVTIEAPLTTLIEERSDEDYLDGTFSYTTTSGETGSFDLKLRARGRFRLQESTCNFPPVRLNFRKKQVKDTIFDGQDKLKLVAHCQQNKPSFEQLVLREYLVYRFMQVLSDKSFRVRLMHINWIDTEGNNGRVRHGFVIEDDDDVAERLGMKAKKTPNLESEDLAPAQMNLVSVFAYMIGNTDFSLIRGADELDCCHNSVPMTATGGPPYTPVPYDFDFAGMVNAPYAAPNPRFGLRNVRQRLYRGRCVNNERLPETFEHFVSKRTAMLDIIAGLEMVSNRTKRDVTRYLDGFYRDISNPETVQKQFIDMCVPAAQPLPGEN